MAVFILSIGSVYALLFRADLRQHLLHVVVYYIVWSFLSASVIECSTAFIDAERYLRQEALPKLAFVFRVVWRNAFAFLHNLVLVPAAILALRAPIAPTMAYALAGMLVLIVNLTLFGVIVAVVCTRFRDLRQIIQSGAQLAFFTSPVMWKAEALPLDAAWIVEFSPVAQHLRLACDPLLGLTPTVEDFTGPLLSTAFLVLIATPLFVRLRERLVYWL